MSLSVTPSAASSALSGIRAASDRLDKSAATVVSAGLEKADTVSLSAESRQAATSGTGTSSIVSGLVDLRVARYQNAASVAVLRSADEMTNDLLSLGRSRP